VGILFRRKKVGAEYYLERGEECLKNGNYLWAVESLTKAIEFEPGLEAAYYGRSEAYRKLGREREAVWDLIRFLEVDRRGPGSAQDALEVLKESISMAGVFTQRDNAKSAILSFGVPRILDEMIVGYDPSQEYKDSHFYDLALSWLEEKAGGHRFYTGFVKLLKKKYDEAMKEFDEAIGVNPENPDQYYFRGIALIKKMGADRDASVRRPKNVEFGETGRPFFEQALAKGYKGRICPGCGYRTSSTMNFCLRCGERLLG
jgi:tetratricopeptide (TPR) repeat protein